MQTHFNAVLRLYRARRHEQIPQHKRQIRVRIPPTHHHSHARHADHVDKRVSLAHSPTTHRPIPLYPRGLRLTSAGGRPKGSSQSRCNAQTRRLGTKAQRPLLCSSQATLAICYICSALFKRRRILIPSFVTVGAGPLVVFCDRAICAFFRTARCRRRRFRRRRPRQLPRRPLPRPLPPLLPPVLPM